MRIQSFVLLIAFTVIFKCAYTQPFDTVYVVSQYWFRADGWGWMDEQGNAPMHIYLPNNQQLTLFARQLGQKPTPSKFPRDYNRQVHCLRIIKPYNHEFAIRIVMKDSTYKWKKKYLAVDTTFVISEVPFNRNIITHHYPVRGFFQRFTKLIINNQPRYMSFIPYRKERTRKRFLKGFLKAIQYEYNVATGILTQLYQ